MSFNGRSEFARAEALGTASLVAEVRRGLAELEKRSRGVARQTVRGTRSRLDPALDAMLRAGDVAPDAERARKMRRLFELWHREDTKASGALRETIEALTVRLRALELRAVAIAGGFDEEAVRAYREPLAADLWNAPPRAGAAEHPSFDWEKLPPELHQAWLDRLAWEWSSLNWMYLQGELKVPIFELSRGRERLGMWIAARRTIAISGHHIATHSWDEVVETLKHEMAHQLVSEGWCKKGAMPHGPEFRAACEKLRCSADSAAATERLERLEDSADPTDRVVARIQKLLALGRSPNQHEAALAMEKASELLARFNLDESELRARPSYRLRWVGQTLTRREEHHHNLATILSDHFFVRVVWAQSYVPLTDARGLRMTLVGSRENLDVAEYVHDYLLATIEELWTEHRASPAFAGGRRSQYQAGVTRGFLEKLEGQKQRLVKETALVWKEDGALEEHLAHVYPRLRTSRWGGVARGEDYDIGVEQGRELTLRMGVTERGGNGGKLLPP
jgi:hypothetical protein